MTLTNLLRVPILRHVWPQHPFGSEFINHRRRGEFKVCDLHDLAACIRLPVNNSRGILHRKVKVRDEREETFQM